MKRLLLILALLIGSTTAANAYPSCDSGTIVGWQVRLGDDGILRMGTACVIYGNGDAWFQPYWWSIDGIF